MKDKSNFNNPFQATFSGISNLLKKRERVGYLSSRDRLDGKKVLITGASSGLGFATAVELAKLGAIVIMAVRSGIPKKGKEVKRLSGSESVFMLPVDLADFDSIVKLVDEVRNNYGVIDIVICNAAIVAKKGRKTKNGLEEMFQVNYLANFFLLRQLLKFELLNVSSVNPSRIIIVNSESHRDPKAFEWDSFGIFKEHGVGETVALYGYYKLLLLTFARELARQIKNDKLNISVFALCPGPVNSNIAREAPAVFRPLLKLVFRIFFRSPKKASEPVVYFSASQDLTSKDFDYMFLMQKKDVDIKANNSENGKKLWLKSEDLIEELGYSAHI